MRVTRESILALVAEIRSRQRLHIRRQTPRPQYFSQALAWLKMTVAEELARGRPTVVDFTVYGDWSGNLIKKLEEACIYRIPYKDHLNRVRLELKEGGLI